MVLKPNKSKWLSCLNIKESQSHLKQNRNYFKQQNRSFKGFKKERDFHYRQCLVHHVNFDQRIPHQVLKATAIEETILFATELAIVDLGKFNTSLFL